MLLIVPTLCVVTHPVTLRVAFKVAVVSGTQSVRGCMPTRSVGTIHLRRLQVLW
ncbi:UNVERIFIED_ORG: hypothetical protein J3D59_001838 [Pseudomonas fluorescens]